jgi:hypothetical protein
MLIANALLSTQEAEYAALSEAIKEALCLCMLLLHLGFGDPEPTAIYCDNKGAITMGLHPTNKAAMRQVRHTRTFLPTTRRSRQRYHPLLLNL